MAEVKGNLNSDVVATILEDEAKNEEHYTVNRESLADVHSRNLSLCMWAGFLINTAMMIYSHFGVSADIKLSIPEGEDISVDIEGGCTGANDTEVFELDDELREQTNLVAFNIGLACLGEDDIVQCFIERLSEERGLSGECSSCYAAFTDCLQTPCIDCRVNNLDQAQCEVCIDAFCEYDFEKCSGLKLYEDSEIDACVQISAFQPGNALFDLLPILAFEKNQECASDVNKEVCIKDSYLDEGPPPVKNRPAFINDDCLGCLQKHSICVTANCASACVAGAESCESCVLSSGCASDFDTCSGVSRYSKGRVLIEEALERRFLQVVPPVIQKGDCVVKNFTMFSRLELTFVDSVEKSLQGGSLLLGLLIGIASGIWPYFKNILMAIAWFTPMKDGSRQMLVRILGILGKWSLVDVFAVVLIANGILVQKVFASGIPFVLIMEPRPGIYFFGFAALWALAQGEVIHYYEQQYVKKRDAHFPLPSTAHFPSAEEQITFRKQRALVAFLSIISFASVLTGVYLDNLVVETVGLLSAASGTNDYRYNVFQLGIAIFDDCAIYDGHESVPGAYFLGILFIFLVAVLPAVATGTMFWASLKLNITNSDEVENKLVHFAMSIGNFAALDVWMVTLFVFSNQFSGLIQGAIGTDNVCGLTPDEEEAGVICIGLEGSVGLGAYVLAVATVTYWAAQIVAVRLNYQVIEFAKYHDFKKRELNKE